MSSYTAHYNLFRPSPSDAVDVTIDLTNNFDKIDAALAALASGHAGSANLVVSPTTPNPASLDPHYLWVQTNLGSGHDITIWFEDGS